MYETLKKQWIDKRVIVIGNDYQSNPGSIALSTGVVVDILPISKAKSPVPMIKFDHSDEPVMSFGCVIKFTDLLYNVLVKLTPEARWRIVEAIVCRFSSV